MNKKIGGRDPTDFLLPIILIFKMFRVNMVLFEK